MSPEELPDAILDAAYPIPYHPPLSRRRWLVAALRLRAAAEADGGVGFYKVDDATGKVTRLRKECPNAECGAGTFMANHFDRHYCGKCGLTYVYNQQA
uniref:Small ribosomal subunit protein eS31 domain-containing protein n=1 Tax=Oryza nivara TaxID=4536 RepID=A0A0E0HNC1_ORYNI